MARGNLAERGIAEEKRAVTKEIISLRGKCMRTDTTSYCARTHEMWLPCRAKPSEDMRKAFNDMELIMSTPTDGRIIVQWH
jgi:hypothetical protein